MTATAKAYETAVHGLSPYHRIHRNLESRPSADISQKTLMVLVSVYPEDIHYKDIAAIIGEKSESAVSAALSTWTEWGMSERTGNRDGMYKASLGRK